MASLARLTSLSTQTLSLLLERQRLQTLPTGPAAATHGLHMPQIARNMQQLRAGVLDMEEKSGRSEAVALLRSQYERMRSMLGPEGEEAGVQRIEEQQELLDTSTSGSSSRSHSHSPSPAATSAPSTFKDGEPAYTPYTDDPEAQDVPPEAMLQSQRQLMDEQDVHLDSLSRSISRQHHISLQIGDELDVHAGLLDDLDHGLDHTDSMLTGARRRLDHVARGAKENGSTVMIGLLILVLLILIIVFKT